MDIGKHVCVCLKAVNGRKVRQGLIHNDDKIGVTVSGFPKKSRFGPSTVQSRLQDLLRPLCRIALRRLHPPHLYKGGKGEQISLFAGDDLEIGKIVKGGKLRRKDRSRRSRQGHISQKPSEPSFTAGCAQGRNQRKDRHQNGQDRSRRHSIQSQGIISQHMDSRPRIGNIKVFQGIVSQRTVIMVSHRKHSKKQGRSRKGQSRVSQDQQKYRRHQGTQGQVQDQIKRCLEIEGSQVQKLGRRKPYKGKGDRKSSPYQMFFRFLPAPRCRDIMVKTSRPRTNIQHKRC